MRRPRKGWFGSWRIRRECYCAPIQTTLGYAVAEVDDGCTLAVACLKTHLLGSQACINCDVGSVGFECNRFAIDESLEYFAWIGTVTLFYHK